MSNIINFTKETMQEIMQNNTHDKYEVLNAEIIDTFKEKERRKITIKERTKLEPKDLGYVSPKIYEGIVEVNNKNEVISVKSFNLV